MIDLLFTPLIIFSRPIRLGDKRDTSQDSRVMSAIGFIPAAFIFFSTDGATRFSRLIKIVN